MFFGRASEDVDTWVSILSNYFVLMSSTPHEEIAYAATLLRDAPTIGGPRTYADGAAECPLSG